MGINFFQHFGKFSVFSAPILLPKIVCLNDQLNTRLMLIASSHFPALYIGSELRFIDSYPVLCR